MVKKYHVLVHEQVTEHVLEPVGQLVRLQSAGQKRKKDKHQRRER